MANQAASFIANAVADACNDGDFDSLFDVFVFCEQFATNDVLNLKEYCKHRIVRLPHLNSIEQLQQLPLALQMRLLFDADVVAKKAKAAARRKNKLQHGKEEVEDEEEDCGGGGGGGGESCKEETLETSVTPLEFNSFEIPKDSPFTVPSLHLDGQEQQVPSTFSDLAINDNLFQSGKKKQSPSKRSPKK